MNKLFYSILAVSISFNVHSGSLFKDLSNYVPKNTGSAKAVLALGSAAGAIYLAQKLKTSESFKNHSEAVGLNSQDMGNVVQLAGGLGAFSFMASGDTSESLRYSAKRTIPVALCCAIGFSKKMEKFLTSMPVIGENFKCPNDKCESSCHQCRLTKGVAAVTLYSLYSLAAGAFNEATGWSI